MTPQDLSRRDVLRGLGGFAVLPAAARLAPSFPPNCYSSPIPAVANRALASPGVHGYAQKSLAAGDTIDFRVKSEQIYTLSVVRLGWDAGGTSKDWTLATFQSPPVEELPLLRLRPGSYIHVEDALSPAASFPELTLECWVRPFRHAWQGLITQYTTDGACGYALFVDENGFPGFYFGNGGALNPAWMKLGPTPLVVPPPPPPPQPPANPPPLTWVHLAAVFSGGKGLLYVDGVCVASLNGLPASVTPGPAPLRLGAAGNGDGTDHFLDGDLAMPAIYPVALKESLIVQRASQAAPPVVSQDPAPIGCWPLDEEQGAFVADASLCGRHGLIVNHGTWMIGGPSFEASLVPRFGPYDPDADPDRGHGLRLSSSDLYDCAWPISHSYTLPTDCPPGIYVGRIVYDTTERYDITFVVRRNALRPPAPLLVLAATSTWLAYNQPFGLFGFYADHDAGQPAYLQGLEMPWVASTDPYLTYKPNVFGTDYAHLVRAERHMHNWLEQNGYDYDVVGDHELHLEPELLSSYRAVCIVGHSEYWTRGAYDAVQSYLAAGGRVLMASGNTMFWRVSLQDSVIECRKLPQSVGGRRLAEWGELYHQHDHLRGGLMRECGAPAWAALGLECVGYGDMGKYLVDDNTHAYFTGPESITIANGAQIGGAKAVGHEWDVRLDKIPGSVSPTLPIPGYAPHVLAHGIADPPPTQVNTLRMLDYHCTVMPTSNPATVICEITDWVRTDGGRVFAIGSIAAARALHNDVKMASLFRNALHHNGVVFRLELTAIGQDGHFYRKAFDGTSWSPSFTTWEDMGAGFGDNPSTGVQWAPNNLASMAITPGGTFLYRFKVGSAAWSNWVNMGGTFAGRPVAVAWGRNRMDLFARSGATLKVRSWNGSTWSTWLNLAVQAATSPTAVSWEGRRLGVAVLDTAGDVLFRSFTDNNWAPSWTNLGGTFQYAPTLVTWGCKSMTVFTVDLLGQVRSNTWDGNTWSDPVFGWEDHGGSSATRVHAGSIGADSFKLFVVDPSGQMQTCDFVGGGTTAWSHLSGATFVGEPAVASYRGGHLSLIATATDGKILHNLWNGAVWSGWQDMGGTMRPSPGAYRWVAS